MDCLLIRFGSDSFPAILWETHVYIYSAKWVLVAAIAFFETGSLLCGVLQNAIIVGRTVSGMGAAGMCA